MIRAILLWFGQWTSGTVPPVPGVARITFSAPEATLTYSVTAEATLAFTAPEATVEFTRD